MLQDIVSFLEKHGISARTTGFLLVLGNPAQPNTVNQIDLSAQEVAQVCSFSSDILRKIGDDPFQEAYEQWLSLRKDWEKIFKNLKPSKRLDIRKLARDMQKNPTPFRLKYKDCTDDKVKQVLKYLLKRTESLEKILSSIAEEERSETIDDFLYNINEILCKIRNIHKLFASSYIDQQIIQPDERTLIKYTSKNFINTFNLIHEDICAIANLAEDEKILDIFQLNLWSTRPQLYEVWVLIKILGWLEVKGYQVELLQLKYSKSARVIWHLSYAKACFPCAKISQNTSNWLFYFQKYQKNKKKSGDMPDFCIIDSSSNETPLVAIDAKHSEKCSYSLTHYKNTAIRYRDSFGASLSLVVEYFTRLELSQNNSIDFKNSAVLIKDAQPCGKGIEELFTSLNILFPTIDSVIICIDYSSSFIKRRDQAFYEVKNRLLSISNNISDTYVCFAGTAVTIKEMKSLLSIDQQKTLPELHLEEGTSLQAIIAELEKLKALCKFNKIILVGDGEFFETDWSQSIERKLGCIVELYS
jgi:hypothetical protein